ncbi:hypothetical protein NSPZN2_150033 [Nitrospira defluvii]|uniref:Uncharacterized protein n=1 Tax=Nitrospira defluvii TaxID=330214 RepID=A0ABM8RAE6_9BACT|nr:hypothetical protein NSPZN2_150033 [Nitrospira defluvii]
MSHERVHRACDTSLGCVGESVIGQRVVYRPRLMMILILKIKIVDLVAFVKRVFSSLRIHRLCRVPCH